VGGAIVKICAVIPSRRRPQQLAASLQAFHATESQQHEVAYVVSYCHDDPETRMTVLNLPVSMNIRVHRRTDHCVPGQAFNEAAEMVEADAYLGLCDDIFPLTMGWDHYIIEGLKQYGPCACWIEATDRNNTSYIFSDAKVLKAIGKLCPEYFPFWFCDVWLAEICHFAFGQRPSLINGLMLGGRRGRTQGHHELGFWLQVFAATRIERIELASKLAAAWPFHVGGNVHDTMDICKAWDADMLSRVPIMDDRFNEQREPEPYYVLAKQRALAMLADRAA
jgi:hypothetical protein